MLARATVAVAAAFAALLLLLARSGASADERLFVASPRVPTVAVQRPPAVSVVADGNAEKPKPRKKEKGFKAPAWMRQCEYAWDCFDGLECCEFAGASFCCRGGVGVPAFIPQPQPQLIPIPVPVPSPGYPRYPGGGSTGPGGGYPYP
jgi:hypothetical protein